MTKPDNRHSATWDIFCDVVDNYGDIGVTWRLARQLWQEYQIPVRLWVNDLSSFQRLVATIDPRASQQMQDHIAIWDWCDINYADWIPGPVVIEAFACQLPVPIRDRLTQIEHKPIWINLEYLSAETWIDDCHALPSWQTEGLQKYFYFPGFSAKSGGLFHEQDLEQQHQNWCSQPDQRIRFCQERNLAAPRPNEWFVSLFCYENPVLPVWLEHMATQSRPIRLLIPEGRVLNSLRGWLQQSDLPVGSCIKSGQLWLEIIPMTDQTGYDHLLWSCDFNIVRGEDSFLRAQWAEIPFLWHIYPQEESAHLDKLTAFIQRYTAGMTPALAQAVSQFFLSFNREESQALLEYWTRLQDLWPEWQKSSHDWPKTALAGGNLTSRLVHFVKKKIECCA